ncbi:MAG: hypothetical protein A2136_03925 [Chloroflexi bacterium RBG_16_54_11]|nr:MAG: hypothetical protein A2136_03925 [Chloroflexi bacterium RBG_16_54_11]
MQQRSSSSPAGVSSLKRIFIASLRLFFILLYHQFAWTYDLVAYVVSLGAWKSWVQVVLPYLKGPRVLEIGFGPGHLQTSLHGRGFIVFGLDESAQMSRITYRKLMRLEASPKLVRGAARHLPFAGRSFDQVVMTFPAEFLYDKATYTEIHRVLLPNGSAVLLPLAWITGRKPLERAAAWLNHIIGEASAWDESVLEPIQQLGFTTHWEMLDFPSSKVLLIKLTRQDNSSMSR